MKIVSQESLAATAADRIYRHHSSMPENRRPRIGGMPWEIMVANIRSINDPSPEDISNIVGSSQWTDIQCDECGLVVRFAAEFETSEFPISLCHTCLISSANAVAMEETK